MVSDLLSPIFTNNYVCNMSEDIFDYSMIRSLDETEYENFVNEYKQIASQFCNGFCGDDYSAAVSYSLVMVRLIELNVILEIDDQILCCLLKELSGLIQLFDTIYRNEAVGGNRGIVVSFNETMKVCRLLQGDSAEQKNLFTVGVVGSIPVTNITLAFWNERTLRHNGIPVKKEIRDALKAMSVYNNLLGSGVRNLLLGNTYEKAAKKIKIFKQVGLDFLFDRILDFYMCKMMDEKRGFLDNIENVIADEPVVDILNSFLSGQCSKK